jgi:hypothetical protein
VDSTRTAHLRGVVHHGRSSSWSARTVGSHATDVTASTTLTHRISLVMIGSLSSGTIVVSHHSRIAAVHSAAATSTTSRSTTSSTTSEFSVVSLGRSFSTILSTTTVSSPATRGGVHGSSGLVVAVLMRGTRHVVLLMMTGMPSAVRMVMVVDATGMGRTAAGVMRLAADSAAVGRGR